MNNNVRSSGGPPCPRPNRLRELIDVVGDDSTLERKLQSELIDALDWLATSLENRALYHKKQQLKKKVLFSLASQHGLIDEANALTEDALHSFVSNQKPDKDDELTLETEDEG